MTANPRVLLVDAAGRPAVIDMGEGDEAQAKKQTGILVELFGIFIGVPHILAKWSQLGSQDQINDRFCELIVDAVGKEILEKALHIQLQSAEEALPPSIDPLAPVAGLVDVEHGALPEGVEAATVALVGAGDGELETELRELDEALDQLAEGSGQ